MKNSGIGRASNDLANKFIWSGFKYFFDYYIIYSPIKYWKSQHLIDKKFLEGFIANRADFHASEGGLSVIAWKNENTVNKHITLQAVVNNEIKDIVVNKIKEGYNTSILPQGDNNGEIILINNDGVLNAKSGFLVNKYTDCHAKYIKLFVDNNIKQALPLFAANCYTCKDYTEKEVIMKSGDGGIAYQNDNDFLEDCFLWCCLTDKNKCWSDSSKQNEMALDQNSKADQIVDLTGYRFDLFRSWRNVLGLAKTCDEYNSNLNYGLAQIINDLNISEETGMVDKNGNPKLRKKYGNLDEIIKSFKEELKAFYSTYIEPKLFEYELLK